MNKLPIAAAIILVLLVSQFNSLRRPAIIIAAIPLAQLATLTGFRTGEHYGLIVLDGSLLAGAALALGLGILV